MAIIETRYGKVEGATDNGLHSFKGIPFAAPPIGEKRWSSPEPPKPWAGVRAANGDWGKQAWQQVSDNPDSPLAFVFNARNAAYRDEDCLQLNVWTRGLDDAKRAVMVWIHGGGFSGGTGGTPVYDGTVLAERCDVVVVTINYRVGAFGWLNLNELTDGRIPSTGNEGLLDQVEGLKWVRDNISAFGGDSDNVTIFGESSGGMSVGAHLAFGPSKGLFHRAIPISGSTSTAYPISRAVETTEVLLDRLGLSAKTNIKDLFALEAETLTNAMAGLKLPGGGMTFQPIMDGTNLKELPIESVRKGSADGISVLVGTQRDEFLGFSRNNPHLAELDEAGLIAEISKTVKDAPAVVAGYREIREARGADTDPVSLFAAIETDRKMRMPAITLAEAMAARGQSAYHYIFAGESPWNGGIMGSPHAIIIGFVFGTHAFSEASAKFFGKGEAADTLSVNLQDAFAQLAKTGNPRTEALSDLVAYDTETRSTAIFGTPIEVASAPYEEERLLWIGKDASLPFGPELW
jgi:para-nitrobenzyl esterase